MSDKQWFWPAVIFAVALVLRVTYTLQVRYTPFFQTLGLDAKFYDQWARDMAMGQSTHGAYFMSPLYPYFLSVIYRLFGRDLLLIRLIQAVIGSGTAVLAYVIGRRVFDRNVGIVAGFATACYGALIFYDGSILMTPLLVFLSALALASVLKAEHTGLRIYYLAAGAAFGLATIGRAAALVPTAAVAIWIFFAGRSRIGESVADLEKGRAPSKTSAPATRHTVQASRYRLRAAALIVLGVAAIVIPVTIRNYVVAHDFVAITSNGGLNFYIGNSESATGGYARPEGLDIITDPDGAAIAERAVGHSLKPSAVSAYWYARARDFIFSHPGEWSKLLVKKIALVLSSYELPQLENYYFQRRYSPLLRMPLPGFAVIAPLGLLGMGLAFRRRRKEAGLLAAFAVTYLLSIAAFFVVARYRLPVVPVLAAFASYALLELISSARARKYGALTGPVIALAVLALVVNANLYGIDRQRGFAQPHYRLGIIYAQRGMPDAAVAEFEQAIQLDPRYEKSYLNLGAVLSQSGESDRAIDVFKRAIRLDPGYALARINLAMTLETRHDYEAALAQIDTVLGIDSRNAMALKERGIILYRAGRPEEAAKWLKSAIENDSAGEQTDEAEFYLGLIHSPEHRELPQAAETAMERADTLAMHGRIGEAVLALEEARGLAPESGEPLRRLALIKRQMGLLDEAISTMEEALRVDPGLVGGHFVLGVMLNEAGRHEDAIREYEAAVRIDPDLAGAHLNLALTYNFYAGNPNLAAFHYRRYLALGGDHVEALDALLRELDEPDIGLPRRP